MLFLCFPWISFRLGVSFPRIFFRFLEFLSAEIGDFNHLRAFSGLKVSHGQIKRWRHDKYAEKPAGERTAMPESDPQRSQSLPRILLFRKHLSSGLAKTASSGEIGSATWTQAQARTAGFGQVGRLRSHAARDPTRLVRPIHDRRSHVSRRGDNQNERHYP